MKALTEALPSAVCLDLNMPDMSGMETLERIRQHNPLLSVLVMTADDAVGSVVQAMKLGAFDYMTKPLDSTKVLTVLRNAVEKHRLTLRISQLEREAEGRGYPGIVGSSPAIRVSAPFEGKDGEPTQLRRTCARTGGRPTNPAPASESHSL